MEPYDRELAVHLRINGVPEREITDIVADVAESRAAGADVVSEFGTPQDYAANFSGGKPTARQRAPLFLGVGLGIGWIVVTMILLANGWSPRVGNFRLQDAPQGLTILVPALILMGAGLVANFLVTIRPSRK